MARAYWNGGAMWSRPRRSGDTELRYQCRNWHNFNWLSGDHITEQHVHNLDVINWAIGCSPREAHGQGGREVRVGPDSGQIFDHHHVEYAYQGGATLFSQCRNIPGCRNHVGEYVHGTAGYANVSKAEIFDHRDQLLWKSDLPFRAGQGYQLQMDHFFAALRRGDRPDDIEDAAHSTMTAIMGRMATYSGRKITWNQAIESQHALADVDRLRSWSDVAPIQPTRDGGYPVAIPGQTKVV